MKPGTNKQADLIRRVLFLTLFCVLTHLLLCLEGRAEDLIPERNPGLSVIEKEGYFHFFLDDFLNAATHFKLLEGTSVLEQDEEMLKQSRYLLGSLYLSWGMHLSAARIFDELVKAFPEGKKQNEVFLAIERMQYRRARYVRVLETYDRFALNAPFPGVDEATYLAGMSHYATGAMEKGNEALKRILPESRFYPYAQLALAKSWFVVGNPQKSLRLFEKVSLLDNKGEALLKSLTEKARLTWGQLLIEVGRYREAYTVLSLIPKESPFFPDALFGMAWAQFKDEAYLKSILLFEDLIALKPNHPYALEAMTAVGHAYNRLDADQTAIEHYSKAIVVYNRAEESLRTFQTQIQDPRHLSLMMKEVARQKEGLFAELIFEDEGVRYWVSQYQALRQLEAVLDHKLRDTAIFEVVADHREAVFRDFLPKMQTSFSSHAIAEKKEALSDLNDRLDQAIREEQHEMLWTAESAEVLQQLENARNRSTGLGLRLGKLADEVVSEEGHARLDGLKTDWYITNRWLRIAEGEQLWKLTTTLPGRVDDLRRAMRRLITSFERLEKRHAEWLSSIPAIEQEIVSFRGRIESVRRQLMAKQEETLQLQQAILPALKDKLFEASEKRLKRVMSWVSAAELSQLQILDVKGLN